MSMETHFVFPESMLKTMLPVGSGVFMKLAFQAARKISEKNAREHVWILTNGLEMPLKNGSKASCRREEAHYN